MKPGYHFLGESPTGALGCKPGGRKGRTCGTQPGQANTVITEPGCAFERSRRRGLVSLLKGCPRYSKVNVCQALRCLEKNPAPSRWLKRQS